MVGLVSDLNKGSAQTDPDQKNKENKGREEREQGDGVEKWTTTKKGRRKEDEGDAKARR